MLTVVGLGNPGAAYKKTRHNAGFMLLEGIADNRYMKTASFGSGKLSRIRAFLRTGRAFKRSSGPYWSLEGELGGKRFLLVKPETFMNESGRALKSLVTRGIIRDLSELLVVVDDVDCAVGSLRLRSKGSAGGHNGLKSIIADIGTEEFARLRIGVGPRPNGSDMVEYVLSSFMPEDRVPLERSLEHAAVVVETWIMDGYDCAQQSLDQ